MTLLEQFEDLKNKISANPRLLGLTILVAVLIWFLLLMQLMDISDDLEREYVVTFKQLAQTEQLAREDFWEERKKQSREILQRYESKLWPMQNEGLAKATLQNELTQLAEKAGLERIRIQIEKPADEKGKDFTRYTASLTSWFKPEALDNFLSDLMKSEHQFLMDNMELRFKPFPYFKVNLSVSMPKMDKKTKDKAKIEDGGKL